MDKTAEDHLEAGIAAAVVVVVDTEVDQVVVVAVDHNLTRQCSAGNQKLRIHNVQFVVVDNFDDWKWRRMFPVRCRFEVVHCCLVEEHLDQLHREQSNFPEHFHRDHR